MFNAKSLFDLPAIPTEHEIKAQYRRLSMIHHPDKRPNDPEATKKMQEIGQVYQELLDKLLSKTNRTSYNPSHSTGTTKLTPTWQRSSFSGRQQHSHEQDDTPSNFFETLLQRTAKLERRKATKLRQDARRKWAQADMRDLYAKELRRNADSAGSLAKTTQHSLQQAIQFYETSMRRAIPMRFQGMHEPCLDDHVEYTPESRFCQTTEIKTDWMHFRHEIHYQGTHARQPAEYPICDEGTRPRQTGPFGQNSKDSWQESQWKRAHEHYPAECASCSLSTRFCQRSGGGQDCIHCGRGCNFCELEADLSFMRTRFEKAEKDAKEKAKFADDAENEAEKAERRARNADLEAEIQEEIADLAEEKAHMEAENS